jgi:IS30 family transposase
MSHIHFTKESRIELVAFLRAGKNHSECGRLLGMNRSSVLREVEQNQDDDCVYRGGGAHKRALARRKGAKASALKIENDRRLRRHIVRKLKLLWSPEQIAGRLKRMTGTALICHETIYTFVYEKRPELIKCLRRQKNKYRKKRGTKARMYQAKSLQIRRIDERPTVVDTRERIGDWEGDTVVGKEKTQRILTYVERKSGMAIAEKLSVVSAEIVEKRSEALFRNIPSSVRLTLTRDNGIEFGDYDQMLEKRTGMQVYRANPYHSWERGTNENWNGLLRQFFPKGTFFATITNDQVQQAVRLLNNRPRKRLGYLTPREVFRECCNSN